MIVNEPWYSRFKWLIMIVLPAFSSAYFSLASTLDLPGAAKVTGVCAIAATFLGTVMGISNKNYQNSDERFDGDFVVIEGEDGANFRMELNSGLDQLALQDQVVFKKVVQPV